MANVSDRATNLRDVWLADSFIERNGTVFQVSAAVLIAAVSGVAGWFLRRRNRELKTFDFRVVSDLAILTNRPDDDDLKVTYLDEEVRNPRVVRVRFTNTGRHVIRQEDFLDPYVLRIAGSALLDAIITDETGNDLVSYAADGRNPKDGRVTLQIRTLNPGDTFTVQMIVDGADAADVSLVSGRIENESRPTSIEPTKRQLEEATVGAFAGPMFGLLLFGLPGLLIVTSARTPAGAQIGWGLIAAGFVCVLGGLVSVYYRRRSLYRRLAQQGRPTPTRQGG